jgi:two-component system, cell cycle response regulator
LAAARVLVVEDSVTQAEWLAEVLAREGYEVVIARDGAEAVREVRGGSIDLVLLDMMLPDMDGLEVLRVVKESSGTRFVPVIVLSARSDVASRVTGLRTGADDYLPKPFAEEEALARVAGMLRIKTLQDELSEAKAQLLALSMTDGLTGLYNRRFFDARLGEELQRSQRYQDQLALLIIDLDHFKVLNDEHGHLFGDHVLRETAQLVRASVRAADVCARYGGEELAVILPKTDLQSARVLAERILESVRRTSYRLEAAGALQGSAGVRITASIGVASHPSTGIETADALVGAADEALYRAKREGRDTVRSHEPAP